MSLAVIGREYTGFRSGAGTRRVDLVAGRSKETAVSAVANWMNWMLVVLVRVAVYFVEWSCCWSVGPSLLPDVGE